MGLVLVPLPLALWAFRMSWGFVAWHGTLSCSQTSELALLTYRKRWLAPCFPKSPVALKFFGGDVAAKKREEDLQRFRFPWLISEGSTVTQKRWVLCQAWWYIRIPSCLGGWGRRTGQDYTARPHFQKFHHVRSPTTASMRDCSLASLCALSMIISEYFSFLIHIVKNLPKFKIILEMWIWLLANCVSLCVPQLSLPGKACSPGWGNGP
jgi:hypothetical protein